MKKCIDVLATLSVILTLVLLIAALPTERDAAIYEDTLRLHILANSDSTNDQGLKLEIRNRLLEKYGTQLKSEKGKAGAVEKISALKYDMERDIDSWIAEAGYDYKSHVTLGEDWYERREYDGFTLPEGYYTSLKVELGEADGQNWWCVMYPPLCLDMATESAPSDDALSDYTKEEIMLIGEGKYTVKFKLLELTSEIFASVSR